MLFSSPVFLFLFLPCLLGLHFLAPGRLRNPVLLLASLFFYTWGEKTYVLVLLASIAGNYLLALGLTAWPGQGQTNPDGAPVTASRLLLALVILFNLGLLIAFKYANFLADNLNAVLVPLGLEPTHLAPVHLPLGISFFTFQAMSYVLDVARGEVRPLRNPFHFALYISFFPQAIAGPIVRYRDIAGQLVQRVITREGFALGVRRFILGLAKKLLIANTVAGPADAIFGLPPEMLTPGLAWLGVLCYTLQIYFDFSGYSDMAIGLSHLFGFRFCENFNYPYVARSITEFWRRWHISLSTWYRDYLYIPLGGNRCGMERTYLNLVIVFCLCGLWHGASWNFLIWGLFHGAFLVLERAFLGRWLEAVWAPLRHGYTLLVVMVGWVFFRAETVPQALSFLQALAGWAAGSGLEFYPALYLDRELLLVLVAGMIGSTPVLPFMGRLWDSALTGVRPLPGLQTAFALIPVVLLTLLLGASAMLLAAGTYNPFIYFRF